MKEEAQFKSLVIIPVFTAALSLTGSTLIVLDVLGHKRKDRGVFQRLMLGMSLCEMMNSFSMLMATLPVPRDLDGVWGAVGNDATCVAQGFVMQLGGSACFVYNATLTLYFLLVVKYRLREEVLKKREWIFHVGPWIFGFGSSLTCLVLGQLGYADLWCWIGTTGFDNYEFFHWIFWYGPIWVCFAVVLVGMTFMAHSVYLTERESAQYDAERKARTALFAEQHAAGKISTAELRQHELKESALLPSRRSRQVAMQAFLYVAAFYFIYFFCTLDRLYVLFKDQASPYGLALMHVIFEPLQGLFNFLIYRRQNVMRWRTKNPNASKWGVFLAYLNISLFEKWTWFQSRLELSCASQTTQVPTIASLPSAAEQSDAVGASSKTSVGLSSENKTKSQLSISPISEKDEEEDRENEAED